MKKDIDKLNEQIEDIQNSGKKREKDSNPVVEEKEEFDSTDTKKLDRIDDMEEPVMEEKVEEEEKVNPPEDETPPAPVEEEKEEVVEPPKKKKTILYIALGAVALLLIIVLCILILPKNDSSNKSSVSKKLTETEKKKIIKNYGDAVSALISIYREKNDVSLTYEDAIELVNFDYDVVCNEHEIYDDSSLYLNQCSIDQEKVKYSYGKKQEKKEIPAGAVKIYVTDRGASFDEPKDGTKYEVYGLEINETYTDLEFLDAKNSDYVRYIVDDHYNFTGHIVNYKTGKKAGENFDYESILAIRTDINKYDTKYAVFGVKNSNTKLVGWGVMDIVNGVRVVDTQYAYLGGMLSMGLSGPQYYIEAINKNTIAATKATASYDYPWTQEVSYYYTGYQKGLINYTNGQEIVPTHCLTLLQGGSYLFCKRNSGNPIIYDTKGNKYFEKEYDKVYWLINGEYILVQDGKNVKLVNINGKELYNFGEYSFDHANYGIAYDNGALFQFTNNTKGEDYDYDMDDSCLEFIYRGSPKKGEVKTTYCGGIAKPILYLYPKKKTNVTISFEHPEYLETTYPKFIGKWEVEAQPNGDLHDKDGKYYYGLYWDEAKVHSVDFHTGFYVEKDNAIDFLEEKLTKIGLNDREKNEFIMYWLPILEKNEKSLVYFELTEERESVNKILISPKPDSLLRIVIHVKKVDEKVSISEEKLTTFKRKGFTVVEWGGTTY